MLSNYKVKKSKSKTRKFSIIWYAVLGLSPFDAEGEITAKVIFWVNVTNFALKN
jgi:hypothetical protein